MNAPGWYPDPSGQPYQRWWDGTQWTDQTQAVATQQQGGGSMTPADARQWAMFAHLSALLLGFIGPLVIYLMKKDEDPFVADQSAESLNFQIAVFIALLVCVVLAFLIIGFFLMPIVIIGALVFEIIGGVRANKGEYYRYPINIRFIKP